MVQVKDDILHTIDKITKHANDLNALDAIQNIIGYINEDNDAKYLRNTLIETESFEDVVQAAIEKFER